MAVPAMDITASHAARRPLRHRLRRNRGPLDLGYCSPTLVYAIGACSVYTLGYACLIFNWP